MSNFLSQIANPAGSPWDPNSNALMRRAGHGPMGDHHGMGQGMSDPWAAWSLTGAGPTPNQMGGSPWAHPAAGGMGQGFGAGAGMGMGQGAGSGDFMNMMGMGFAPFSMFGDMMKAGQSGNMTDFTKNWGSPTAANDYMGRFGSQLKGMGF